MTQKFLSLFTITALLLCTACAANPSAGNGTWMQEVHQTSATESTIFMQ